MTTSSIEDVRSGKFWAGVLAELMGTAMLVFACASWLNHTKFAINTFAAVVVDVDYTRMSLCFGFTVATLTWMFGHVSGSHFNPALTLAIALARRMSLLRALLYVLAQIAGSLIGACLLVAMVPKPLRADLGTPVPQFGVSARQSLLIEFLCTLVLVLTVFSCIDRQRRDVSGSVPLTVGCAVTACHLWALPLNGAGMNPARVLGPAVLADEFKDHWTYWIGPILAAIVGAVLYELVFAVNATPQKLRGCFSLGYDNDDYDDGGLVRSASKSVADDNY